MSNQQDNSTTITVGRDGYDQLCDDRRRYRWLANRVLACDYGDNGASGDQVGWRIRHDLLAHNGERQPAFMYGPSIDAAIDAANPPIFAPPAPATVPAEVMALVEAAQFVVNQRHIHDARGPDGSENCAACGANWRDTDWHFRKGESVAGDYAALRAALAAPALREWLGKGETK